MIKFVKSNHILGQNEEGEYNITHYYFDVTDRNGDIKEYTVSVDYVKQVIFGDYINRIEFIDTTPLANLTLLESLSPKEIIHDFSEIIKKVKMQSLVTDSLF